MLPGHHRRRMSGAPQPGWDSRRQASRESNLDRHVGYNYGYLYKLIFLMQLSIPSILKIGIFVKFFINYLFALC